MPSSRPTVKKSHARIASAWERRNCDQLGPLCRAGSMLWGPEIRFEVVTSGQSGSEVVLVGESAEEDSQCNVHDPEGRS